MINTYIPFFQKKDQEILKKCLKTNYVSTAGPLVSKFEKVFQKKYRFENCLALNSGTSALHVALKSIGVKEGDTVIMHLIHLLLQQMQLFTWLNLGFLIVMKISIYQLKI